MKLYEFHIADAAACAPCHGYPVASRRIRIRGVQINLTCAAGCHHGVLGRKGIDFAGFDILYIQAKTAWC